jgi:beta-N-acetylhexosaminidase
VSGSEGAGVATTPKHFPGHGETPVDSHLNFVDVTADRETIEKRDLVPFRAAFAAGATMVMTAHVRFHAYDKNAPATLSRPLLTGLLRDELGFGGLCITDSLDMSGINVDSPDRVIGRAIDAGVDAVMVTSHLDRQLAASGWIRGSASPQRLAQALERATAFRTRFGAEVPEDDIDDGPARALAAEIATRSITHVGPPLPRLGGSIRVVAFEPSRVSPAEELSDPVGTLEGALRKRFGDRMSFGRRGQLPEGSGPTIVFTFNASFDAEQARALPMLLGDDGVLVALRSPYDASLARRHAALLSYCDVPVSLEAVAAALAGERPATGQVPVRIP